MAYLLGIDNGGTVSKAALFDENGNQIAVSGMIAEIITPKAGYMERDLEKLWEVNAAVIREVITKSKINPKEIAGISFSGQGKGLYMLDENGIPVYNGILSSDMRAWKYVKKWYKIKPIGYFEVQDEAKTFHMYTISDFRYSCRRLLLSLFDYCSICFCTTVEVCENGYQADYL